MSKRVKNVTPSVTNPSVRPTKATVKSSAPMPTSSTTKTTPKNLVTKPESKPPPRAVPNKPLIKLKSTTTLANGSPSRLKLARSTVPTTPKTSIAMPDSTKRQPVRAVYDPRGQQHISAGNEALLSHKNVMNTVHNVTVLSPPRTPIRSAEPPPRNITEALLMANNSQHPEEVIATTSTTTATRDRTRTHTLGADEVLVLKRPAESVQQVTAVVHKDPVAFDIDFGESVTPRSARQSTALKSAVEQSPPSDEDEYEDDFDSYESDFESCSSTSSAAADSSGSSSDRSAEASVSGQNDEADKTAAHAIDSVDVDSGMYDWKIRSADLERKTVVNLPQNDGQMDSGFGLSASSPTPAKPAPTSPRPPNPSTQRSKRAADLLNKITLDTMSFALFELKPIPYDRYMRMFGHRNATQTATQTPHRGSDQDVQTDDQPTATVWTQFPAEFVRHAGEHATGWRAHEHRAGCGRIDEDNVHAISAADDEETAAGDYGCAESLRGMARFEDGSRMRRNELNATRPLDLGRLNLFLQQSAVTVAAMCQRGQRRALTTGDAKTVPGSLGYRSVDYTKVDDLRDGRVRFVVGNGCTKNVLLSVHSMDVQKPDSVKAYEPCSCLVSAWNVHDHADTPLYVLSSWSAITCLEMNSRREGLVFGGLADGFVAVWNVTDSKATTFGATTLSPCQLIEPLLSGEKTDDYGAVVAIRCCTKHDDQLFALHEYGLLTAWTLLPAALNRKQLDTEAFALEQLAPWARQRLVQTAVLDLRAVDEALDPAAALHRRRPKSGFERTRSHFESNLFSDAALQELQQQQAVEQPPAARFTCTDLLCTTDGGDLLVATNRTHLLRSTAALHKDGVSRISIADDGGAHATRLAVVHDSVKLIAVGMSDGSVRVLLVDGPQEHLGGDCGEVVFPAESRAADVLDNIAAKSCAIQNIIEDERPVARRSSTEDMLHTKPDDGLGHPLYWRNQQRLLHGLALNAHPVRWMSHAPAANRLWVLQGGALRVFDCERMEEIEGLRRPDGDAAVVACGLLAAGGDGGADMLTLLTIGGDIQVHSLGRV